MAYTLQQFIDKIKPYAIADMKKNGILASLTIAQAIIESNKGNSGLTLQANNLFGIKGTYNGQSVKMWTTEYYNGVKTRVQADFRKYPSWLESINDHSEFLRKYKRYASIIGETDYVRACQKMGASGYATSPTYGQTLLNCINTNKLYLIDQEAFSGKPVEPAKPMQPAYKEGQTYITNVNLFVRCEPKGEKKLLSELSVNAKLHAYNDGNGYGILKKGTKVTCKGITVVGNQTWMKIPSGYICAINNGTVYIE